MVVSLALLALIIVPVVHIIVETQTASDGLHYRAEAADLATQALETAQYQTANGRNLTAGITTSQQLSGKDTFNVAVDAELVAGTGADGSVCIDPPGQLSSQIWTVKATVSWGSGGQRGTLVESTLISPQEVDLADTNAAEIAVPMYNADQTPETTTPITSPSQAPASRGAVARCQATRRRPKPPTAVRPVRGVPQSVRQRRRRVRHLRLATLRLGRPDRGLLQAAGKCYFRGPRLRTAQSGDSPTTRAHPRTGRVITMDFQTVSFTPITVSSVSTTSGKAKVNVTSGGFPGVTTGMIISGTGIPSGATVSSIRATRSRCR